MVWRSNLQIPALSGGITKAERLMISGPEGPLEALFEYEPNAAPPATAIVCHPHPLYGGTMHNKVVYRAAKGAIQAGLPTLRFNFRGVGKSAGEHANGVGESEDVRAALDYVTGRFPARPVCLIGYSFGAAVGLSVGVSDPRVRALVGIGVPAGVWDMEYLRAVNKPTLIVQGTGDIFGPRDAIESLYASLAGPKRLNWVEAADHFFIGRLDDVQHAVRDFIQETLDRLREQVAHLADKSQK